MAADLDLVIGTAEEREAAIVAAAREVAGAVHPRAGRVRRGIGQEALGGQAGPPR